MSHDHDRVRGLRNESLYDRLLWCATTHPERTAVIDRGQRYTWEQIKTLTDQLAASLLMSGFRKGDVISVQLPNCIEFVLVHLAVARIGAILNTLHMAYRRREIAFILTASNSVAAIVPDEFNGFAHADMLAELRAGLPALREVFVVGPTTRDGTKPFQDLLDTSLPSTTIDTVESPQVSPDDVVTLWYTSGTEGTPKGVLHSHNTLVSNGYDCARELWINANDVILSTSPMTHAFGLLPLYLALGSAAAIVMMPLFSPQTFLELAVRERVSFGFVVPAALAGILASQGITSAGLNLRHLLVSGTQCPPSLVREAAARLRCHMGSLWGMTELMVGLVTRPDDAPDYAATSVGRSVPGSDVCILDPELRPLSVGEVGELGFRGPSLCLAYHASGTRRDPRTSEGWFLTGDLASVDDHGFVKIVGRKKDLIDRGGVKFNPQEVEELLVAHPKILQAAVVGMPDPRLGERACAFVVMRPGETVTLDELVEFLGKQGIAKFKYPERLEVLSELPVTPTRKVQRGALRQLLVDGTASVV